MSADEVGNPWTAALASFLLFTLGAVIPILPWIFIGGIPAIVLSAVLAAAALYSAGAVTTLFTGRSVLFSGSRMLVFGLVAAGIVYGIGRAIGVGTGV
jgi:VIT1/CCC1 family predicted Fe2+/Mn2+ transporter